MKRSRPLSILVLIAIAALACGEFSTPTQAPVIVATFGQPGSGQVPVPGAGAQPVQPPAANAVPAPQLDPSWTTAECSPAQVAFGVPPAFDAEETVDVSVLWIHSDMPNLSLEFTCDTAQNGGTFDTEMAYWFKFQRLTQWDPVTTEASAIGKLGWAEGRNEKVDHILGAVLGPTRNGHIVWLWAMAPGEDWIAAKEIILRVLRSARYAS